MIPSSHVDVQYANLVEKILRTGVTRPDRTGVGTISIFGHVMRFNMQDGFPLLTTKKVPFKLPLAEMLWMLAGSGNAFDLHALGAKFWDKWAKEDGDLGRVYGVQWRTWRKYRREQVQGGAGFVVCEHYDQIAECLRLLREDPYSRRILTVAFNPGELDEMVLPPCPYSFQLYVAEGKLSLIMNWRSVDVGIGMPFDIAVYAFLLHAFAHVAGMTAEELICVSADTHIYHNHIEGLQEQLKRTPFRQPVLHMTNEAVFDMDSWAMEDFDVQTFGQHPHILLEANV